MPPYWKTGITQPSENATPHQGEALSSHEAVADRTDANTGRNALPHTLPASFAASVYTLLSYATVYTTVERGLYLRTHGLPGPFLQSPDGFAGKTDGNSIDHDTLWDRQVIWNTCLLELHALEKTSGIEAIYRSVLDNYKTYAKLLGEDGARAMLALVAPEGTPDATTRLQRAFTAASTPYYNATIVEVIAEIAHGIACSLGAAAAGKHKRDGIYQAVAAIALEHEAVRSARMEDWDFITKLDKAFNALNGQRPTGFGYELVYPYDTTLANTASPLLTTQHLRAKQTSFLRS